MIDGRPVVDLWGGIANRRTGQPWERKNTLVIVWSSTKGAVALCRPHPAVRGLLDLDAPVAAYWPEFAAEGKVDSGSLATQPPGLPAFRRPLTAGGLYDWNYLTEMLATEKPFWQPGTRQSYHASTFGHLVGEVIRRISGTELATFFREEVGGAAGPRFPPRSAGEGRGTGRSRIIVPMQRNTTAIHRGYRPPPGQPGSRCSRSTTPAVTPHNQDQRGACGGVAEPRRHNQRTRPGGPVCTAGGTADPSGACNSWTPILWRKHKPWGSAAQDDGTLRIGLRFGLGFMKSSDNRMAARHADSIILSESAFGHAGMGGSLGFADPESRLSFGYAMNKQGRGVLLPTNDASR